MKKLLNTLGVLTLTSSLVIPVVACKKNNSEQPTNLQNEMLDGAEFVSRLIIAARHENLNFNINELLSAILTPEGLIMRLPQSYVYNNEKIDIYSRISNFKKFLAPSLETLDQDKYSATMASYIMGMYSNDFYSNIINGEASFNDTMGQNGELGINKADNNALGYLAGLNSELSLAQNQDRRNLAWGIQDNGALTNYLLNKGIDGAYPGDMRANAWGLFGPGYPKADTGGTNASGYSFYNSMLHTGVASHSAGNPIDEDGNAQNLAAKFAYQNNGTTYVAGDKNTLTAKVDNIAFGEAGALIAKNTQENNVFGGISLFASMLDNASTTSNGSLILGELANTITPVIVSQIPTESFFQAIGFSLITNLWEGIYGFKNNSTIRSIYANNPEVYETAQDVQIGPAPLKRGQTGTPGNDWVNLDEIGFSVLGRWLGLDNNNKPSLDSKLNPLAVQRVIDAIDAIIADFEQSTDQNHKNRVINEIFSSNGIFGKAYATPILLIGASNWDRITNSTDKTGVGAINLMKLAKFAFESAINPDIYNQVINTQKAFVGVTSLRNLTASQKQIFIRSLGYSGSDFNNNTYLGKFYEGLKNPTTPGQKEFNDVFASLKEQVNGGMKDVHEKILQYIFDDKYWNRSNSTVNTTSNLDLSGKLEFDIKYTGYGDNSSTASSQTKAVEVPQNFNPYQTILKNQTSGLLNDNAPTSQALAKIDETRISGKVLGVEQGVISADGLIKYDGTGLLTNYKPVNFEYKVKWENVSNDPNNPYWVIAGIDCFKNGVQFYNIY